MGSGVALHGWTRVLNLIGRSLSWSSSPALTLDLALCNSVVDMAVPGTKVLVWGPTELGSSSSVTVTYQPNGAMPDSSVDAVDPTTLAPFNHFEHRHLYAAR